MSKFENMTFENFLISAPEANLIKDLRLDLGLTTAQAAKLAGLNDGALWRKYESGDRKPNQQTWTVFLMASGQHPNFKLNTK
ncbi:helix-turn-helix transcriptional regulator (plasmid) [Acinetobacter sp. YH12138]|uniref:helix-turn-helix domain-containing protein n=1 Tax=Acinetobacter sp. YH12138 TaxID=2601122 RepID=UPI0015D35605|nr:helix-turn-helix transcriptional regulator [Acinetobacter sp. YH12138]QOW51635.1 helix-turn-helix transcriptional regulator [Acinetobacter sp. YH12138]